MFHGVTVFTPSLPPCLWVHVALIPQGQLILIFNAFYLWAQDGFRETYLHCLQTVWDKCNVTRPTPTFCSCTVYLIFRVLSCFIRKPVSSLHAWCFISDKFLVKERLAVPFERAGYMKDEQTDRQSIHVSNVEKTLLEKASLVRVHTRVPVLWSLFHDHCW